MSRRQAGFSLVEALVAMVMIVIGALALAATLAGSAAINSRTTDRQKAIALAEQQIDKLRSFSYDELGLAPCTGTGCPAISGGTVDPARQQADWAAYCPIGSCADYTGNASNDRNGGRIVTETPQLTYATLRSKLDPRQAKQLQFGGSTSGTYGFSGNNSYQQNGMVAYTYIYWPYDEISGKVRKDWKIATVVVRFRDNPGTNAADKNFGTVKMSTVIVDNPGLGQIPEVDTVACSDGLDNDSDGQVDAADAVCHSDGNASNFDSYTANGTSEN